MDAKRIDGVSCARSTPGASGRSMVRRTGRGWTVMLLAAAVLAQGCAPARRPHVLGRETRESLGTVGVCSVGGVPPVEMKGSVGRGEQAARGAAKSGGIGFGAGAGAGAIAGAAVGLACGPFALVCSPIFALYGAAIGGVSGAVTGGTIGAVRRGSRAVPTDVAQSASAALSAVLAERDVQDELRRDVLEVARSTAAGWVDLGVTAAPDSAPGSACVSQAGDGAQTVLQISVVWVGFVGGGGKDPNLALTIDARASLVDAANHRVIWADDQIVFRASEARLAQWTADGSWLLRSQLQYGIDVLASRIAAGILPTTTLATAEVPAR